MGKSGNYEIERGLSKYEGVTAILARQAVFLNGALSEIAEATWNMAGKLSLRLPGRARDADFSDQPAAGRHSVLSGAFLARLAKGLAWPGGGRRDRCYDECAACLLHFDVDTDWCLVHGTIEKDGRALAHAWLKSASEVYDPMLGGLHPIDAYVARNKATAQNHYERAEAIDMLVRFNHSGPWHRVP
jgi:hypothetical protein